MPLLNVTSPYPSAPSTKYFHTGIGGAGNYRKTASTKTSPLATGTSLTPLTKPSSQERTFPTGRGGAGNRHFTSESAIFSFDEELERMRRSSEVVPAPIYHVGRGGAGNTLDERRFSIRAAGSISSGGTDGSGGSNTSRKLRMDWMRERWGRGSTSSLHVNELARP